MTTEAGKRLLNYLTSIGACLHPHPDWITSCWACDKLTAIEAEAVAAEQARMAKEVEGLDDYHGWTMRPPNAQRWIDRAAVLAIVETCEHDWQRSGPASDGHLFCPNCGGHKDEDTPRFSRAPCVHCGDTGHAAIFHAPGLIGERPPSCAEHPEDY